VTGSLAKGKRLGYADEETEGKRGGKLPQAIAGAD
jgi:hypothetical protein